MPMRGLRKRFTPWPFYINVTPKGVTSWGIKIGRVSWNAKTGKWRINTPFIGWWESKGRKAKRR